MTMTNKPTEPTTEQIREYLKTIPTQADPDIPGILLRRLDELQYRHECLKSLYDDVTNYPDPEQAETDIDEFIRDEQSHS